MATELLAPATAALKVESKGALYVNHNGARALLNKQRF